MSIEPRVPGLPDGAFVPEVSQPSFPLNVQEGSPQYTLTSQVTPSSSTVTLSVTNTDSVEPISNAYYTIQNEDGSKWCTFYIGKWTTDSINNYTGVCTYSSSNTTDVFPEGSTCWCVWAKEYYDSLTTSISNVDNEINTVNSEIDTLTPKVNNSFVSATKIGDSTLRLTRNNGTSVDISFPKGINLRNVDISDLGRYAKTVSASSNELVIIRGSISNFSFGNMLIFSLSGYGYLTVTGEVRNVGTVTKTIGEGEDQGTSSYLNRPPVTASGLLYNGAKLTYRHS